MKQPKLYVPGHWVQYTDKTVDFKPFTCYSGTKNQVKEYIKAICKHGKPEFICNRPFLLARLGMRPLKDVRQTAPIDIPEDLFAIVNPDTIRQCG
jgi:hypothetical protein